MAHHVGERTAGAFRLRGPTPQGGCVLSGGCMECGRSLTYNEVGAYKKFVNRGSTRFLCKTCLSAKLGITEEEIDEKIRQFKLQGCTLFV